MLSPRMVGQIAAIAGRSMVAMVRRQNFDIAISAPVLPADMQQSASPGLHRLDRLPHGRLPAAMAQRLARLVVHPHGDLAVDQFADGGDLGVFLQDGPDFVDLAVEKEPHIRAALGNLHQAGDDHGRSVVAAHRID